MKISAVINTWNEAKNIARCLRSVSPYVDEIIVVDMESVDETVKIAKTYTRKIFKHPNTAYVEPARNFAISKASGDWVMILDADEVLFENLGLKLRRLAEHADYSYYRIPRKNIVFGKWLKHSGWWPDYQIRFFRKNAVSWGDEIHSIPITEGKGMDLLPEEKNALIHHHYENISQYIERLNRYTTQEVQQLVKENQTFTWKNVILKPTDEFLRRFFAWEGYKDGLHGLILSLLQAVSFLVVQLKLWEQEHFKEQEVKLDEVIDLVQSGNKNMSYWYFKKKSEEVSGATKQLYKMRSRLKI